MKTTSDIVQRAMFFAREAHKGQIRKYNGEPYIIHPKRVVMRVIELDGCDEIIAAAWLHDVIEDCDVTGDTIGQLFGATVRDYVLELTNPSKGFKLPRTVRKEMDREHIAKASRPARIIKLLDRIDNLNDMKGCKDDFLPLYKYESKLLLEALRGTHEGLEKELELLCT